MSTALVTGANRGIGLELCHQIKERGDNVIAVCRRTSNELQQLGVRVEAGVDVTSDADVTALKERLAGVNIGLLINCAGILTRESLSELDFERIRRQFEVNALGPLRVTASLLDNLGKDSKVAIITSRMGSIGDNTSGSRYGYRMSKAAVNMAGVSLAHDLQDRGIARRHSPPRLRAHRHDEQHGERRPPGGSAGAADTHRRVDLGKLWGILARQRRAAAVVKLKADRCGPGDVPARHCARGRGA